MTALSHLLLVALCYGGSFAAYTVPPAKLEAIWPKGLRVSVKGTYLSITKVRSLLRENICFYFFML